VDRGTVSLATRVSIGDVLDKLSRKIAEESLIAKAVKIIMQSKKLVVFTGAGISTESGIPDFRGTGGLWTKYDPMKVASIDAFRSDPKAWWNWAVNLGPGVLDAKPNKAHRAVAELDKMGKVDAVITQNIDGLHQKAGSKYVLEVHGSMATASCTRCRASYPREQVMELIRMGENPPMCDVDGGILKPDVVLFGEPLPPLIFQEATKKSMECDAMLIAGSSLVVYPAAALPALAKEKGAKLVLINEQPTEMDGQCDVVINGKAGQVLPKIVEACRVQMASKA